MASHVVVQMPSESTTTHMQALSDNATEDIHICGKCKQNFTDINIFIKHKQNPCHASMQKRHSSNGSSSLLENANVEYVTVATTTDDSSTASPVFRVYLEANQSHQLSSEQESQVILQHLQLQGNQESVILRSRLLGSESIPVIRALSRDSNENKVLKSVVRQRRQMSSDAQMDDEVVASILANQLSNEVISIVDPCSLSNETPRYDKTEAQKLSSLETCETHVEVMNNNEQDETPLAHTEIVIGQCTGERCQDVADDSIDGLGARGDRPSLAEARTNKTRHDCPEVGCGFGTFHLKDLVRHMRSHTGERPYTCTVCRRAFSRNDKLQVHQRMHAGIKPHSCSLCSYAASDTGSLKKHMRVHTNERPYKCQICSYRSRDTSQLTVHLRTHTGDTPFVCSFESCTSAFKTNSDLKRHIHMHTGEKPFACRSCDFRCNVKSNLRVHIRLNHVTAKMVKCRVCEHIAPSKRAAKEHEKLHADEVLKCGLCLFTCVSATGMKNHHKTHSDDKPIACKHCSYTCRFLSNLKRHLQLKHADMRTSKGNSTKRPYVVQKVPAQSQRFGCKSHQCSYCDASFVREESLRCHVRQHKNREQLTAIVTPPRVTEEQRQTSCNNKSPTKVLEDSEPKYMFPDITAHSLSSTSASSHTAGSLHKQERRLSFTIDPDGEKTNSVGEDRNVKSPQQQILSGSTLQSQPLYVYLANEEVSNNEHILAPIMFANHCHYVTIPSEQYSVSVQGGGQYVLSGPLERVTDSDITYVQNSPPNLVEANEPPHTDVDRDGFGRGAQVESVTVIKKFGHHIL